MLRVEGCGNRDRQIRGGGQEAKGLKYLWDGHMKTSWQQPGMGLRWSCYRKGGWERRGLG